MPFGDPQFIQQMHSLGLSPTMSPLLAAGNSAPSPTSNAPPPMGFQVPPLRPFNASSAPPVSRPYAQYGGPEQTYFTGNTLQNFGWPGPQNPGNQAAATPATPDPATVAATTPFGYGGDSPGNMATGGRVKTSLRRGALNALAKNGGL